MAIFQIFIKSLDGKTKCLQISSPTISGQSLRQTLHQTTQIPLQCLRLVSGSQEISNETLISASNDGLFPSCNLILRLRGGKGGFGSLLRGAATKAGQKKTNNFDACRDMSGRRLRHVNAEKKLEEWKAEADERKLEKIAEDFLKKKAKQVKKTGNAETEKYIEKYREDSAKCMEEMENSVRQSFALYENSKRMVLPASGSAAKKLKLWTGKAKAIVSDSSDDEDDEKSVVLDDGNSSAQTKLDEGTSGSVSGGQSDEESAGGGSTQSNLEEETEVVLESGEGCGNEAAQVDEVGSVEPESGEGLESGDNSGNEALNGDSDTFIEPETEELEGCLNGATDAVADGSTDVQSGDPEENHTLATVDCSLDRPLNFDDFKTAQDMEVLGMERLKTELQARGLKCGGTLQERAARLFLLKTTPIEKLPKKLLAKPKSA